MAFANLHNELTFINTNFMTAGDFGSKINSLYILTAFFGADEFNAGLWSGL